MKRLIFCFFLSSLVTLSLQTEDNDLTKESDSDAVDTSLFNNFNNTNTKSTSDQSKKEILPVIINF